MSGGELSLIEMTVLICTAVNCPEIKCPVDKCPGKEYIPEVKFLVVNCPDVN